LFDGESMNYKLRPNDRHAVDFVLNRGGAQAPGGYAAPGQVSPVHVDAVEKTLRMLERLPVSEPPKDLVQRTLARISDKAGRAASQGDHLGDIAGNSLL
jgi:hypothetical protein